jgi:hypothetical protein
VLAARLDALGARLEALVGRSPEDGPA